MNRCIAVARILARIAGLTGILCSVFAVTPSAWAIPWSVTFKDALLSGGAVTTLPHLLDNGTRNIFLRFTTADFDTIKSINSIDVTVRVYDDGDLNSEDGDVLFAVRAPDTDFVLGSLPASALAGTDAAHPLVFTHSLIAAEIADAFGTVTDNAAFRIRVMRTSGDFFVLDGAVQMDAVPEPGSLLLLGTALGGLAWARVRRGRIAA